MNIEEFIKQRCEIDKITEEEFEKRYRVVECNCGQPYCKGYRCLDLDGLLKENQELKKQLENKYSKTGVLTNEVLYEENTKLINQQKKFIEYLEYQVKFQEELNDIHLATGFEEILSKYKEIIGVSDEKK